MLSAPAPEPTAAPRGNLVAPPPSPRLYWLDWVRFLAALIVLLDHIRDINWGRFDPAGMHSAGIVLFAWAGNLGREAVAVFFVLSGLLVGGKLVGRVRAGRFDAASYAADRLARVYVPLIPALLWSLAVVRVEDLAFYPREFAGALFSVQGGTHKSAFDRRAAVVAFLRGLGLRPGRLRGRLRPMERLARAADRVGAGDRAGLVDFLSAANVLPALLAPGSLGFLAARPVDEKHARSGGRLGGECSS